MMTMTEPSSTRPAWPRNLGRAVRDAAAAVALGVVIGLAYARISEWPTDRVRGGLAEGRLTVSAADPGAGLRMPAGSACPSSPSVAPAVLPACGPRAQ